MLKEEKTIKGEIQAVKKDFKGVQVNDEWYSSFKILDQFERGEIVEIIFVENKGFKNIKEIKKILQETKGLSDNKKDMIASQLISYSKDILISMINTSEEIIDKNKALESIVQKIIEEYNKIRKSI